MDYSHQHTPNHQHNTSKGWRAFIPLVVLFFVIIVFTLAASWVAGDSSAPELMRWFMGGFFVVFGFFKVINVKEFALAYSSYDLIAKRVRAYGYVYPFIELVLGVAYLISFSLVLINSITLIVMLISAAGVARELLKKNHIPCACLGMVFVLPMTTVTLIEDLLMAVMAVIMLLL